MTRFPNFSQQTKWGAFCKSSPWLPAFLNILSQKFIQDASQISDCSLCCQFCSYHLERWKSLCSGQPPYITSTTLRASSGLFFHTSDALRQILSMLLMSAQGRHQNSPVQEAGEGNRARQGPKSDISFQLQHIFLLSPWQSVIVPLSALWVRSPLRSISNECGHERTHPW